MYIYVYIYVYIYIFLLCFNHSVVLVLPLRVLVSFQFFNLTASLTSTLGRTSGRTWKRISGVAFQISDPIGRECIYVIIHEYRGNMNYT